MLSNKPKLFRSVNCWLALGVGLPLAATIAFVAIYALATPLTDEWLMVGNAMLLKSAPSSVDGILVALHHMRWFIYEHPIFIPNTVYLLIMPPLHYDTRVLVGITLMCFMTMVIIVFLKTKGNLPATIAMALIAFSTSHYMEYFWGFQFAFAMSTAFAVIGLATIESGVIAMENQTTKITAGFILIALGLLCSAGAAFGFFAALVFILKRGLNWKRRLYIALLGAVLLALAITWRHGTRVELNISAKNILMGLSSLGGILFSSPVSMRSFGLDARSVAGALLITVDTMLLASLVRRKCTDQALLACSLIVFGAAAIGAVTLARTYIGNWHLQLVLPVFMGSIMLAVTAFQIRETSTKIFAILMFALLASGVFGYVRAYVYYGPAYRGYAEKVTEYMRTLQGDPNQPKPFPETGGWDVTVKMVEFLKAAQNPSLESN